MLLMLWVEDVTEDKTISTYAQSLISIFFAHFMIINITHRNSHAIRKLMLMVKNVTEDKMISI